MKIINDKITLEELEQMAQNRFGDLVKAVVDIEKRIMAVDAELHADEEALLIEKGSRQEVLWGINIYPEHTKEKWIEFDSMINLKPAHQNRSRSVENPEIRVKITEIVNNLIK
ncbi:MAG: hypothetical protein FD145_1626 [Candidatus Saganbacteria bacterium]|uniref:Uncharacterized protein n=1 Tax=Candidatus Saganbacteria bacterium TaxID=2575572 RepID=A0A833NXU5_UNCSA|nr:MAG: hypothetical protein FD145_1626 [Candidatus Saganbacteria bacterium]